MKKKIFTFIFTLLLSAVGMFVVGCGPQNQDPPVDPQPPADTGVAIERIGIGGGGSFYNAMVNPTDENNIVATCDMGALYYSFNQGKTWDRSEAIGVFTQSHMADDGTIFAGGFGLSASYDKGKTVELIYPKNVKKEVSRCGWNERLRLADGFDNGYLKCITTYQSKVYFVTIAWEGGMRLLECDYYGNDCKILYEEKLDIADPMSDIDMYIAAKGDYVYLTFGTRICKYSLSQKTMTKIYETQGYIKDLEIIEDNIFFIDDLSAGSKILYTKDFESFSDLMDFNNLTTQFTRYGRDGTFNWHFKQLSGINFDNIFLSFCAPVNEYDDTVEGVMKFNGSAFEWVFDNMYKTKHLLELDGWSYGSHGPIYGIYASTHNENICVVANGETIYIMDYPNDENKKITNLICKDNNDGTCSTTGLDVQTTYSVKQDPFNKNHLIICTTDLGLQNSYDNGKSWKRMELVGDHFIYNTCYDLMFDEQTKDLVYGLFSSRHDAPYNPTIYDRDTTKGAFGISYDGGNTWNFEYSTGIPSDAIPVKMSTQKLNGKYKIAVATFNRGFYISYDSGKTFASINNGMDTVEELIYGEDVVLDGETVYCLVAPYLENGYWKPAKLYKHDLQTNTTTKIDMGENIVLARSLTYHKQKGLFINVIPMYEYKWYIEHDNGLFANINGGIYHYDGQSITMFFENEDGIFNSTFSPDGIMYATDTYGKVFKITETESKLLVSGLFNMLKNVCFCEDKDIMYITCFGGGTYRINLDKLNKQ